MRMLKLFFVRIVLSLAVLCVPAGVFAKTVTVEMTAEQWKFTPSTVTVEEGDTVVLNVTSIDVDHGIFLSEYAVDERLVPDTTTTIAFIADTPGTFSFFCNVFCGTDHGSMTGKLVVTAAVDESESEEEEVAEEESEAETIETRVDTTAPIVSSITATETTTGTATITWKTDEAGYGQVEYGTESGVYVAATPLEEGTTKKHTAFLTGLSIGTTYYYRIKTQDIAGNIGRSDEKKLTTTGSAAEVEESGEESEEALEEESPDEEESDSDIKSEEENEENADNAAEITEEAPDETSDEVADQVFDPEDTTDADLYTEEDESSVTDKESDQETKDIDSTITDPDVDQAVNTVVAEENDTSSDTVNWMVVIIIIGILFIVVAGVLLVRQMRR